MIQIQKLKKKYGKLTALDGVSFEIKSGSITGLVGPNGCGKTTLIKSILGLVVPEEGNIFVQGMSVRENWEYRRHIGYMPQNPEFPGNLTIQELLDLLEDVRGVHAPFRQELFEVFQLGHHGEKPFSSLSGGTKQKVAAVAALMFQTEILILDEPTVGLDPFSAIQFKEIVRKRAQEGASVLLVSHLVSELEQMVNRMIFVLDGQVHFSGSIEELRKQMGSTENLEAVVVRMMRNSK